MKTKTIVKVIISSIVFTASKDYIYQTSALGNVGRACLIVALLTLAFTFYDILFE